MPTRFLLTASVVAVGVLAASCDCNCPGSTSQNTEVGPLTAVPTPSPAGDATQLASDKPYVICDIADAASHPEGTKEYETPHLSLGQEVTIGPGTIVSHVTFPDRQLDMIVGAGGSLSAMSNYNHTRFPTGAGPDATITHLVRIHDEPDYTAPLNGPKCDKSKHIIRISFCYLDNGKWFCPVEAPPPSHHYGDVHGQS